MNKHKKPATPKPITSVLMCSNNIHWLQVSTRAIHPYAQVTEVSMTSHVIKCIRYATFIVRYT